SPVSSSGRLSWVAPAGVGAEHRVQNREELAHAGREGHLLRLAGREEALIDRANHGVATRGDQRGHVERRANGSPSAPNEAFASERAAVARQWGHADEGRDLFAGQRPEFGEIADKRATDDGTN